MWAESTDFWGSPWRVYGFLKESTVVHRRPDHRSSWSPWILQSPCGLHVKSSWTPHRVHMDSWNNGRSGNGWGSVKSSEFNRHTHWLCPKYMAPAQFPWCRRLFMDLPTSSLPEFISSECFSSESGSNCDPSATVQAVFFSELCLLLSLLWSLLQYRHASPLKWLVDLQQSHNVVPSDQHTRFSEQRDDKEASFKLELHCGGHASSQRNGHHLHEQWAK